MKMPTTQYDKASRHGKMKGNFFRKLQIKGHEALTAVNIQRCYGRVTQKISLSSMNIADLRMVSLKERFSAHIRAICTLRKISIRDTNCFGVENAALHKSTTMYFQLYIKLDS